MNHIASSVLDAYVAGPGGLPADVADRVEDHVVACGACRAGVARRTSTAELDRSWAAIERRLRVDLPPRVAGGDASTSLVESARGGVDHVARRRWARPALVAAALVVAVGGLGWAYQVRQRPASTAAVVPTWDVVQSLTSGGELIGIAALLEWHHEPLVVAAVETPDGQGYAAWTSTAGGRWENRTIAFPEGCDPWGGISVVGDVLAIGCVGHDPVAPSISVATTSDLAAWTVHQVGSVASSFGVVVGSDGDHEVSVAVLEAADPNTTMGARLRVWTSGDLSSWTERTGSADDVFTDAFAQRIRLVGGDIVIVGAVNTWPDGPAGPAGQIPAVWVSVDGAPFTRHLLSDESGGAAGGYAHDVTATEEGYVVVGGDQGSARAWFGADLDSLQIGVVTDPEPLGPSGAGSMWSVAALGGTSFVATSVGDPAVGTPTWVSRDSGRTWQPAGDGPSVVMSFDHAAVGVRTTAPFGLWRLELR